MGKPSAFRSNSAQIVIKFGFLGLIRMLTKRGNQPHLLNQF